MQFAKDDPNAWLDDDQDNPVIDLQKQIMLLAELTPLEYDQQRDAAARRLGVRTGTLDKEVTKARGKVPRHPLKWSRRSRHGMIRLTAQGCSMTSHEQSAGTPFCPQERLQHCLFGRWALSAWMPGGCGPSC